MVACVVLVKNVPQVSVLWWPVLYLKGMFPRSQCYGGLCCTCKECSSGLSAMVAFVVPVRNVPQVSVLWWPVLYL